MYKYIRVLYSIILYYSQFYLFCDITVNDYNHVELNF